MQKIIFLSLALCIFITGCSSPALHGIGVYEGNYPPGIRHSFGYHPDGRVNIKVSTKNRPVILVLSSYEPIAWNVVPENGVKIKEIILSGYHPSKVTGVNSKVKIEK
jgi:hypothetical protein